jgi:hypothetical protein
MRRSLSALALLVVAAGCRKQPEPFPGKAPRPGPRAFDARDLAAAAELDARLAALRR